MPYRSVNPATGEVLKTFAEHTDSQVLTALAAADKAFRPWSVRPYSERSRIISKSAEILLARKEELARIAALEMGKRVVEGRGEVELSAVNAIAQGENAAAGVRRPVERLQGVRVEAVENDPVAGAETGQHALEF